MVALSTEPDWSAETQSLDHGREFITTLGDLRPVDGSAHTVELVQFEHLGARREEPQLRINGLRYTLDQAADLLRFVQAGLDLGREGAST
jgi:hypothetical protein